MKHKAQGAGSTAPVRGGSREFQSQLGVRRALKMVPREGLRIKDAARAPRERRAEECSGENGPGRVRRPCAAFENLEERSLETVACLNGGRRWRVSR